ncbi:hypothetical protein EW026_g5501 [Hermanssonia centrifuga]|uniref:FAD/NAD(P)-binding domain-containing protein n=1 Tax=Hermanssonia centrifuga TaxID=98765 RepID=A0A4S4KE95_9APHY|nr:hypothetical protein EW026_g5501 [Hermanssonia centrifuga]
MSFIRHTARPEIPNMSAPSSNGIPTDTHGKLQEDYPPFQLGDSPIDDYPPFKVVVIGAGVSGIHAGIRFRQRVPNLSMSIYEKLDDVGGTWHANKYPHLHWIEYQFSYDRKTDWSSLYSTGSEIKSYLKSVVDRYALSPYINLQHEMTSARYNETTGKWHVRIKRLSSASSQTPSEPEEFEDTADLLFSGTGLLSRWSWPEIDGLQDFKGLRVHSGNWDLGGASWEDDVKEWKDKNVAVIGIGSTGLQVVSALQNKIGKLYNFARGRAWIAPPFVRDTFSQLLSRDLAAADENYVFTEDEKKALQDPELGERFRRELEQGMNSMHSITMRDTPLQGQARFDTSFLFPFPIIGRNGVDIREKWKPLPRSYLSVCVDEFPNWFFACGPNSVIGTGSVIIMLEHQVEYAVMAAMKMQRERLKSVEVKKEAVEDFDKILDQYFPRTVFSEKVRTWYKSGKEEGRVIALWPGSTLHALRALRHPRWEDFNYEKRDETTNRLCWLGGGMTVNEINGTGDRSWYLNDGYVDIPPLNASPSS